MKKQTHSLALLLVLVVVVYIAWRALGSPTAAAAVAAARSAGNSVGAAASHAIPVRTFTNDPQFAANGGAEFRIRSGAAGIEFAKFPAWFEELQSQPL